MAPWLDEFPWRPMDNEERRRAWLARYYDIPDICWGLADMSPNRYPWKWIKN